MPTPIDRAMNSKNLFFGFAGLVTAAAAWSIWGQDMFPQREDPRGDPQTWSEEDLRLWLNSRDLQCTGKETREELLARVEANMRAPRA
ncbi:hypothetical protein Q7P37_002604 [Cladosporium fusiforme]